MKYSYSLPHLTTKVARRSFNFSTKPFTQSLGTALVSRVARVKTTKNTTLSFESHISQSYSFSTSANFKMLGQDTVPFVAQNAEEVEGLLNTLNEHSAKAGGGRNNKKTFSCKKSTFPVAGYENLTVDCWKLQDWDYKRPDLPTYARGLFTTVNGNGQPEIAVRGYDKFFNTGEVKATNWKTIEANTKGPYELSLKENGCIIFLSGLHDGTLLVCSKHSTGPREGQISHAVAGEKWIDRQLAALGRTRQDLARELRKRNVTAVAELCDDDFEEHILAYTKDDAGLYLHGINVNVPQFTTYPGNQVHAFADEWGFKKVQYLMHDTIQSARTFLESCAESGSYNGRDVEGFVIRCKARMTADGPYSDWFFKYKFEEPYLMYRQWRECTKEVISGNPPRSNKKHVKVTENYLRYVRRRLAADSTLGPAYQRNHGIIALRNDFLKEINMKGADLVKEEYGAQAPGEISKDVILVPIATIGCGKTTIAIALQHLFGWGLVQNDNITGKARPPRFTAQVLEQLSKAPAVFADRNNSGAHERKQIIEDVLRLNPDAHLVALHFVHSPERLEAVRKVTQDRVLSRGDNHQTLQASSEEKKVLGIMENFVTRFEPVDTSRDADSGFDSVIDLDPTQDSRQNLETVIAALHNTYPKLFAGDMPTSHDLDDAIEFALKNYKPDLKHTIGEKHWTKQPKPQGQQQQKPGKANNAQKKQKPLEYVAVTLPVTRINSILEAVFRTAPEKATFLRQLQENKRVQSEFHVTLMHRASAKANQQLWERYTKLHSETANADKLGDCKVLLERVVWDDRLMAIVVRLIDENWECTNAIAHITIGTRGSDVKPVESNALLQKWLSQGTEGTGINDMVIEGRVILDGVVHGVLSR